jgi:hypothetical protein
MSRSALYFYGFNVSQHSLTCLFLFCFVLFETGSWYIAQDGLKLMILLPQSPECWDYRCAPSQ